MAKRKAVKLSLSSNGRKAIYIDQENAADIFLFLKSQPSYEKKFKLILEQILEQPRTTRDLYGKESINKNSQHVYAMKLGRGKNNPRIYCQQHSLKDKGLFVIVASELLPKKKSEGLTNKEKQIINRVASYEYEYEE